MKSSPEDSLNQGIFDSAEVVDGYAARGSLFPCEVALFDAFVHDDVRVLDLGVGTGRTTPALSGRGGQYVALDYAPAMLAAFRCSFPDLDAVQGDAADLSQFADQSFDVVVFSFNGIDYLHPRIKREACLAEMARVLAPGGVAILSTHNARGFVRLPPPARERGFSRRVHRLAAAGYMTGRSGLRVLPSLAFWTGEGYRPDAVHGLITYATTPSRLCRAAEGVGLSHERTLPAEHPRRGWSLSTPWYYYVLTRSG